MPDIDDFLRDQAKKLRENDQPPKNKSDWLKRRTDLRDKMFAAMGEFPSKPCDLEPRNLGTLKRDGYTIEKLILQSRPNVWITATAYVPDVKGKVPAVLVVHGHWAWARRDPVVQARCLGLVKLGFFVLAVDAFGAGERFTNPGKGTYHGALYGSTLWPVGHTLLGMQVYDNRRAVDYILSRPEVNGKLGITGASGGGNQSMYAGSLDDRFNAVVPVCSVGNYQAYLKAACCVCEVLPGALTFTEEGDVLGLVAPRALMIMNAAKDAIQFSPAEAKMSVERVQAIYKLHDVEPKFKHQIFDSTHDYNQPMREAMYGWMTLHLKGEGKGEAIPEPKHTIEKVEDLACFADPNDRPKGFLFPPTFAHAVGKELIAKADKLAPDHPEMWEATAMMMREELKKVLSIREITADFTQFGDFNFKEDGIHWIEYYFTGKPEDQLVRVMTGRKVDCKPKRACILLHAQGIDSAIKHPIAMTLVHRGIRVVAPDLRGTGWKKVKNDSAAGASDHNSSEHSQWIGRPLLGQWASEFGALLGWLEADEDLTEKPLVIGVQNGSLTALSGASQFQSKIGSLAIIDPPVSYLTDTPYAPTTPMGILAPGILKVGDIPHLAALIAPRRLIIAGGTTMNGKKLNEKELKEAFAFTTQVYKATKAIEKLTITNEADWAKIEL